MKNFRIKFLFLLFIVSFLVAPAFGDAWFVCLSSFKERSNANKLVYLLEQSRLKGRIEEFENEKGLFYRVLLDEPFETVEEARQRKDELMVHPVVKNQGIKGLWACKIPYDWNEGNKTAEEIPFTPAPVKNEVISKPVTEPVTASQYAEDNIAVEVEESKVLTVNEKSDLPVSKEYPYSVLVRSYKEEQSAENTKGRLNAMNVESYIVKTYDPTELFSFNLHSGAFETEEEAENLKENLEDLGIDDLKIQNYNDFYSKIESYNSIIKNQKITNEAGSYVIPNTIPEVIQKSILQFPVNKNFDVEGLRIIDLDNVRKTGQHFPELTSLEYFVETENIHAISLASYVDDLFKKNIDVTIAVGDDYAFETPEEDGILIDLMLKDGVLHCVAYEEGGNYHLIGVNELLNLYVYMEATDFSYDQFIAFLTNINNDSTLLMYPQVRKNLFVLPNKNPEHERDFLCFDLKKVNSQYAADRKYADWAVAIVGHWEAQGFFAEDDKQLYIAYFDLDYDYIARLNQALFIEDRKTESVSEESHASTLGTGDSWYKVIPKGAELTFSAQNFSMAVGGFFTEEELLTVAQDLQLWGNGGSSYPDAK